jgi:hypothetical protein
MKSNPSVILFLCIVALVFCSRNINGQTTTVNPYAVTFVGPEPVATSLFSWTASLKRTIE